MLYNFQKINRSLSEDTIQEARSVFSKKAFDTKIVSFEWLSRMLQEMKINILESMQKDIAFYESICPPVSFNFCQFTHYIARGLLESQYEEEIYNLFYHIDRRKSGFVDAQDVAVFLSELQKGRKMKSTQIDAFVNQLDPLKLGYLTYEHFVYVFLPK